MKTDLKKRNQVLKEKLAVARKERSIFSKALTQMKRGFGGKVKELSILSRIGDSISSCLDERTVCESIINILISEMTAENCSVMLVSSNGKKLRLKAVRGQTEPKARYFADGEVTTEIKVGDGIAGKAAKTGKPVLVMDTTKNKVFKKIRGGIKSISSLMCIPIKGKDGLIGVINMSHPKAGEFTQEDQRLFILIARQAAMALDNIMLFAKIKRMAEELERQVLVRTRELGDSEQKYKNLMKYGSDAIITISTDTGNISDCNEKACELIGIAHKKCLGIHIGRLFGRNESETVTNLMELPKGRKKYIHYDSFIKSGKKKRETPVSLSASVINLQGGQVIYLTVRDITERVMLDLKLKNYSKRLEQDVLKRTRELKQAQDEFVQAAKLAALGELAMGVAHEINNPVAIIRGYAEDLKDRLKSNELPVKEQLNRSLDMIITNADRCYRMTDEILSFARPRVSAARELRIGDVINSSVNMVATRLLNSNLNIEIAGRAMDAHLNTDDVFLKQVLVNMLNNAIDASGKSGEINIKVNRAKENLFISVTDYGEGIPAENISRIFDPFFTTKKPGKGTGLGLSIAYRIMEKLGGGITAVSKNGKTTFSIKLPAK